MTHVIVNSIKPLSRYLASMQNGLQKYNLNCGQYPATYVAWVAPVFASIRQYSPVQCITTVPLSRQFYILFEEDFYEIICSLY